MVRQHDFVSTCLSTFALHLVLAVNACILCANSADATTIKVLATDPSGSSVTLGPNQNFYLRIAFETDEPISIWARPYFRGKEVAAGSNPSRRYNGNGEALGWFFLMRPGDQVDEVRINVGDGTTKGTRTVTTYPVRVVGGGTSAAEHRTEPDWVTHLAQLDKAAQDADYKKRMSTPPSAGDVVLFNGFMLVMLALGVLGFAAPVQGVRRWRGGWRVAAAVPIVMMAFVVLRLVVGVAADPTSHNLWPFEILQAGALSMVFMLVLFVARRFSGVSR